MPEGKALRYHETGDPVAVLQLETVSTDDPGAGQVLLRVRTASINPSDMGMIGGSYGRLKELPAVAGREGVAEVVALGAGVSGVAVGDLVRVPPDGGAWQEYVLAEAEGLLKVPAGTDLEQAALSFINPPTAWLFLEAFVDLKPGDWVIQNAANSAVGIAVIQLCKSRGIKTLNVVRRAELIEPLTELGADVVVTEDKPYFKQVEELCGGARPVLGLNSVGGESVSSMIKAMGNGGTVVTIGGMTTEPVKFPTRFLIFNDVRLVGLWFDRWLKTHNQAETEALYAKIFEAINQGILKLPIEARYALADYKKAIEHNKQPRLGKIVFSVG
ncbi:MAG: MDR family NADPH-dependent oxidoreductase [Verrucomicrobiota bacterium]